MAINLRNNVTGTGLNLVTNPILKSSATNPVNIGVKTPVNQYKSEDPRYANKTQVNTQVQTTAPMSVNPKYQTTTPVQTQTQVQTPVNNNQSRFIGFQNNNTLQNSLNILQQRQQTQGNTTKKTTTAKTTKNNNYTYDQLVKAIQDFHYDVKNSDGKLTKQQISKKYPEFKGKEEEALRLQEALLPYVKDNEFAPIEGIQQNFPDLLQIQQQGQEKATGIEGLKQFGAGLKERFEAFGRGIDNLLSKGQSQVDGSGVDLNAYTKYIQEKYGVSYPAKLDKATRDKELEAVKNDPSLLAPYTTKTADDILDVAEGGVDIAFSTFNPVATAAFTTAGGLESMMGGGALTWFGEKMGGIGSVINELPGLKQLRDSLSEENKQRFDMFVANSALGLLMGTKNKQNIIKNPKQFLIENLQPNQISKNFMENVIGISDKAYSGVQRAGKFVKKIGEEKNIVTNGVKNADNVNLKGENIVKNADNAEIKAGEVKQGENKITETNNVTKNGGWSKGKVNESIISKGVDAISEGLGKIKKNIVEPITDAAATKITSTATPQDKLFQAVSPSLNRLTNKRGNYNAKRQNADRSNELIIEYGYQPKNTTEYYADLIKTKQDLWKEIQAGLDEHAKTTVNSKKLTDYVREAMSDDAKYPLETNKADLARLTRELDSLDEIGELSLERLEAIKQQINAKLNYGKNAEAGEIYEKGLREMNKKISEMEDQMVAELPGELTKFKKDYGALKDMEEDVLKMMLKDMKRKSGGSLYQNRGRLEALGKITTAPLEATLQFMLGESLGKARDVDFLIEKGFKDLKDMYKGEKKTLQVKKAVTAKKDNVTAKKEEPKKEDMSKKEEKTNMKKEHEQKKEDSAHKEEKPEKKEDSMSDFVKEMEESSNIKEGEVSYKDISTRTLNKLYESEKTPKSEKAKIEKELEIREADMNGGAKDYDLLDHEYAYRINQLAEEEKRIGKVGKNDVNKAFKEKQSLELKKKVDRLREEMKEDYKDRFSSDAELDEHYNALRNKGINYINEYKLSKNYSTFKQEDELINSLNERWSKQPKFVRELTEEQQNVRESSIGDYKNDNYEIKTTDYQDSFSSKNNPKNKGAIYWGDNERVVVNRIETLKESGLLDKLPDDMKVEVSGEGEIGTIKDLKNLDSEGVLGGEPKTPRNVIGNGKNNATTRFQKSQGNKDKVTNKDKQTKTKAFKDWFGDWENDPKNASKVVDKSGKPLVAYHGTHGDFTIFDKEKIGSNTNNEGLFGKGFYFTTDSKYGDYYKGKGWSKDRLEGKTMQVYLDIKNPFMWNDYKGPQAIEKLRKELGLPKSVLEWNNYGDNGIHVFTKPEQSRRFTEALEKAGYDGVWFKYDNGTQDEIVAFEPNQIKSATDNIGTFNKNNPDIRFQKVGNKEIEIKPNADSPEQLIEKNADGLSVMKSFISEKQAEKALDVNKALLDKDGNPYLWTHTNKYDAPQFANFINTKDSKYKEFSDYEIAFFSNSEEMSKSYAKGRSKLANTKGYKDVEDFNKQNLTVEKSKSDQTTRKGVKIPTEYELSKGIRIIESKSGKARIENVIEHKYVLDTSLDKLLDDMDIAKEGYMPDNDTKHVLSRKERIERVKWEFAGNYSWGKWDVDVKELPNGKVEIIRSKNNILPEEYDNAKAAMAEYTASKTEKQPYHYQGIVTDVKNPLVVDLGKKDYGLKDWKTGEKYNTGRGWNDLDSAYDLLEKYDKEGLKNLEKLEKKFNDTVGKSVREKNKFITKSGDLRWEYSKKYDDFNYYLGKGEKTEKDLAKLKQLDSDMANAFNASYSINRLINGEIKEINSDILDFIKRHEDYNKLYNDVIDFIDKNKEYLDYGNRKGVGEWLIKNGLDEGISSLLHNAPLHWDYGIIESLKNKTLETNDYVFYALKKGNYDGVIFKDILDFGSNDAFDNAQNKGGDVLVTFKSKDFKAWDNANPTDSKYIMYEKGQGGAGGEGYIGRSSFTEKSLNKAIENMKKTGLAKDVKTVDTVSDLRKELKGKISKSDLLQVDGEIAGCTTPDGTVYLVKEFLRDDTLKHEFAHRFRSYAEKNNPELFKAINKVAEEAPTELKERIKRDYGELSDDALLDEVFAWKQGEFKVTGAELKWYQKMWKAIEELWNSIKSKFGKNYADLSAFDGWEKMSSEQIMSKINDILENGKKVGKPKNLVTNNRLREQAVWHGSPADFDKFDSSHMGEGEGAQAHGWGHYVAVKEGTARHYADLGKIKGNNWEYDGKTADWITNKPNWEDGEAIARNSVLSHLNTKQIRDKNYTPQQAIDDLRKDWSDTVKKDREKVKEIVKDGLNPIQYNNRIYQYETWLKGLDTLDVSKFKENGKLRNLYNLEIPDPVKKNTPTGKNYLEEDGAISKKELEKINNELLKKEGYLDIANNKNLKSVSDMTKEDVENIVNIAKKSDDWTYNKVLQEKELSERRFETSFFTLGEIFSNQLRGRLKPSYYVKLLTEAGFKPDLEFVYGKNGKEVYRSLENVLGSDKKASKFLESLGYDGIHYFGGRDGEAYVIFNDDALKINSHTRYQKTKATGNSKNRVTSK